MTSGEKVSWETMEGQEAQAQAPQTRYHAFVRAVGALLPSGEERKHPAVRLEAPLEGEFALKRKRLSPNAGKRLRKTLRRYPEGTALGLLLWPRIQGDRLGECTS